MNKVIKIFLVCTSVAPIMFTFWFVNQVELYNEQIPFVDNLKGNILDSWVYLLGTAFLVSVCILIMRSSQNQLETLSIEIQEIKSADNESVGFIIVYLLPLAKSMTDSISLPILIFVALLFFFIVLTSNSYHFNPLLSFMGYHFYEVKIKGGINYILITKRNIAVSKKINSVFLLTDYMILEKK